MPGQAAPGPAPRPAAAAEAEAAGRLLAEHGEAVAAAAAAAAAAGAVAVAGALRPPTPPTEPALSTRSESEAEAGEPPAPGPPRTRAAVWREVADRADRFLAAAAEAGPAAAAAAASRSGDGSRGPRSGDPAGGRAHGEGRGPPPPAGRPSPARLPDLALQGLRPAQRRALVGLSHAVIRERMTAAAAAEAAAASEGGARAEGGTGREGVGASPAATDEFLVGCVEALARAWLGYLPASVVGLRADRGEGEGGAESGRTARWQALALRSTIADRFPLYRAALACMAGAGEAGAEVAGPAQERALASAALVLQDMIVLVAESVAAAYLDQGQAEEGKEGEEEGAGGPAAGLLDPWPEHLHERLGTTRALERFRNQLLLRRWVHRHWHAVVSDRETRSRCDVRRRPGPGDPAADPGSPPLSPSARCTRTGTTCGGSRPRAGSAGSGSGSSGRRSSGGCRGRRRWWGRGWSSRTSRTRCAGACCSSPGRR